MKAPCHVVDPQGIGRAIDQKMNIQRDLAGLGRDRQRDRLPIVGARGERFANVSRSNPRLPNISKVLSLGKEPDVVGRLRLNGDGFRS